MACSCHPASHELAQAAGNSFNLFKMTCRGSDGQDTLGLSAAFVLQDDLRVMCDSITVQKNIIHDMSTGRVSRGANVGTLKKQ